MSKLHRFINIFLLLSLVIISLGIVFGTYLYGFQDNPPAIVKNTPFKVNKKIYHVGDALIVTFDYCRYTDVAVTRYVYFVDGLSYIAPPVTSAGGKIGCHVASVEILKVPNLPSGEYTIIGKNEYKVNFLATRYVNWSTESFVIENYEQERGK